MSLYESPGKQKRIAFQVLKPILWSGFTHSDQINTQKMIFKASPVSPGRFRAQCYEALPFCSGSELCMQWGDEPARGICLQGCVPGNSHLMEWPGRRPGPLVKLPDLNLAEFYWQSSRSLVSSFHGWGSLGAFLMLCSFLSSCGQWNEGRDHTLTVLEVSLGSFSWDCCNRMVFLTLGLM